MGEAERRKAVKPNCRKEIDHSLFLNGYDRFVNNDLVGAGIGQKPLDAEAVTILAFKSRKLEGCMSTQTYNIQEAKAHFSRLLQEAASGVEVIIAKAGKPMARISRIEASKPSIRFGVLKGKVKVSADFNAPLPDELLSEFDGSQCGS